MAEHFVAVEDTLRLLLEKKRYTSLKDILATMNGADIASVLNELEPEKIPLLFRLLPKELAAEAFVEMEPDQQELLIKGFSDSELREVINELYVDDAADLVEEMPANVVKRILAQADPQMRKEINEILRYPEDKTDITGIIYEPWHFRFVGQAAAEEMTRDGLCLEEYLGD